MGLETMSRIKPVCPPTESSILRTMVAAAISQIQIELSSWVLPMRYWPDDDQAILGVEKPSFLCPGRNSRPQKSRNKEWFYIKYISIMCGGAALLSHHLPYRLRTIFELPASKIIFLDVSVAAARYFPSGDGTRCMIAKETCSSNPLTPAN